MLTGELLPEELQPGGGATQPVRSPRSARFAGGGRKIVQVKTDGTTSALGTAVVAGGGGVQGHENVRAQRSPRVQTMEEMDRRIEEDAMALINMKREIIESQKAEVLRAQQKLAVLRKEHDGLHMVNERTQRQIDSILDKANTLELVDRGVKAAGNATQELCNNFNKQLAEAEEIQSAEMRTLRMQQHMLSRLESEIAELRALSAKATFKLDTLRHEIVATENTLIVSKQERGGHEHKLNEMKKTVDGLTKERNSKLGMMQSIIDEGEHSLSRVQGSVFDTFKSPRSRGSAASRAATRDSPARANEDIEDFDLVEGKPEILAKRLSVQKVREMVERYGSRESRFEKLVKLESELRDKIASEKIRKTELQEQIDEVRAKHHTISSSRTKMYKDMDGMANAQWRAQKACDEEREKEQRMRGNIEAIKRGVPRFLSKLTKSFVPIPTIEDLPDVIQKLEDEILRIFKATSAAVQKDTPAEEIAAMPQSQAGSAGAQGGGSEITRLQKLPGFSQLQRSLYFNMMSAKPDNSVNNVRVSSIQSRKGKRGGEEKDVGFKSSIGHLQLSLTRGTTEHVSGIASPGGDDDDEEFVPQGLADLHGKDETSLEGDLVKRISNLVIERDGGGWSKVLERREFERRQEDLRLEKKKNAKTKRKIGVW